MKIEKIIAQLSQKDYLQLAEQFRQNKADKYLLLIDLYRQNTLSEKAIQAELDIKPAAFYTLKSRLFDKIQEYLYKATTDTRIELLQNVANVEHLIYQVPKETAIGLLQKLESELLKNDMPNELITVYKALKKLHVFSPKYYEYQQLYNKYVAYNLAQDKAEEALSSFCKTLSEFYVTKDKRLLDILTLYKREMQNLCRIHQSHRLTVHKNILNIHYALFCPNPDEMRNDDTVEDMLKETYTIIDKHPDDSTYIHLVSVIHFLSFEYYSQLKLYKNAAVHYEKIADENASILLCNHSCFSIHFLIAKLQWLQVQDALATLNEDEDLVYVPEPADTTEYIVYKHYKASLQFYKGCISEAIQTLNSLINEVSFKDILHSEIETKLFLTLLLLLSEKYDQAETVLRSISRKISDEDDEIKHHTALLYIKFFKTALTNKSTGKLEKLTEINQLIALANSGNTPLMPFLSIDKDHLKRLSKI